MTKSRKNEELREGLPLFLEPYLEGYRERVNVLYSHEHANSGVFTYMKSIHLYILLRDSDTHLLFAEDDKDDITLIDCTEADKSVFDQIYSKSDKVEGKYINSLTGLDTHLTVFPFYQLGEHAGVSFSEGNRDFMIASAKKWGFDKADEDYNAYKLGKALEKIISPSAELAAVNTDEILERVKDPAFRYEFGESAKAYNAGLYLAAAATGGIALENLLRILIVIKTSERLPKETYIKDSLAVLKRNKVLSTRLSSSVSSLRDIRNSNAHTNEDPVRKTTVDHLYATIEDLALLL